MITVAAATLLVCSCAEETECRTTTIDVGPSFADGTGAPQSTFGCGHQISCGPEEYRLEIKDMITVVTDMFYGGPVLVFQCSMVAEESTEGPGKWFEPRQDRTEADICFDQESLSLAAVRCNWPAKLQTMPEENCLTPSPRYWIEAVQVEQNVPDAPRQVIVQIPVDLDEVHRHCGAQVFEFDWHEPQAPQDCMASFELLYVASAKGLHHVSLSKRSDCVAVGVRTWYVVTSVKGAA